MFAIALDGQIVTWNKASEQLYGYATSEIIGRHISCLGASRTDAYFTNVTSRLSANQTIGLIDTVHVGKNGKSFDVSITFSPIRSAGGKLIGLSGVIRDITERKMAEIAIAHDDARLRRINDAAFEGIAISQDGVLVDVNEAFASMFGYDKPDDMIGVRSEELADNEFRQIVIENVLECRTTPYEARLVRRDGSTFMAEIRGRRIKLGDRPARVTAVHDISERKKMEDDLRSREASLRAVLESAPIILFTTDADGIVTLAEDTHLAAFGIAPEEFFGKSVLDFSAGDPLTESLMRRSFAGEAVGYDMRVNGTLFHTKMQQLIGPDGKPAGIIGVAVDITERSRSEERFRILFQHSSDAHMIFNDNGIADCNESTLKLLNCKSKEEMGVIHPAVLSPEFQPDGRRSDEKCKEMDGLARQNGFHRFEWVHRKITGEDFIVEVSLTPVVLDHKEAILSVWHDLTEQKKTEQQIKDYNAVLEMQKFELEKANAELNRLATTDGLTGLKNHRALQERLADEVEIANRYMTPLSIIMLDVDHFKSYNDEFGHPAGDQVLMKVARILNADIRECDTTARYGGEEFVLLLPHSDMKAAKSLAERLRNVIECAEWGLRPVTASFGVATFNQGTETCGQLISRADNAMYESKKAGRNCVTCASTRRAKPIMQA
jgi:diguanylate cyclase (GGDEF)-like protein/PAS domain S-box-containing protein